MGQFLGSDELKGLACCFTTEQLVNIHKADPILSILTNRASRGSDNTARTYINSLSTAVPVSQAQPSFATLPTMNSSTLFRAPIPFLASANATPVPMSPPPIAPAPAPVTSTTATSTTAVPATASAAPAQALTPATSSTGSNLYARTVATVASASTRLWKQLICTRKVKSGSKIRLYTTPNPRQSFILDDSTLPPVSKRTHLKWLDDNFKKLEGNLKTELVQQATNDNLDMTIESTFGDGIPEGLTSRSCLTYLATVLDR